MAAVIGMVCVGATLAALIITVIVLWLRFTLSEAGSEHRSTHGLTVRAGAESYIGLTTLAADTRSEKRSAKQGNYLHVYLERNLSIAHCC